jgi:methyl coenzyme M reductase subunit D
MSVKAVAIILHFISSTIAFVVSETQTRRIIKSTRTENLINCIIMVTGGVIALVGTLSIMKVVKKGARQVEENNHMLRRAGK